jgi:hypothetical protein
MPPTPGSTSPVSPAVGDPLRPRPAVGPVGRGGVGLIPTYHSVYTAKGSPGPRDTTGLTAEEVLTSRPRPPASADTEQPAVAQAAGAPSGDAPTDVTVVLPLKIWPGRDADNGRRS